MSDGLRFTACGDVRRGRMLVMCECGCLREAGRPCGYRARRVQLGERIRHRDGGEIVATADVVATAHTWPYGLWLHEDGTPIWSDSAPGQSAVNIPEEDAR